MIQPNLFLIGAPKCGTSSLFDWLSQHPDICGSKVKETFALIDPAHPLARRPSFATDGQDAYKSFFNPEDAYAPYRMEGTTHYIYDDHARQAIASIPNSRVIVALREPASRVFSSFRYTKNNLARLKYDISFSEYLNLIKNHESLYPKWCNDPGSAYVLEHDLLYSRYHLYLSKWCNDVGGNNIHIVTMEGLTENPFFVIFDIFLWLKLEPMSEESLAIERKNSTFSIRNRFIHRVARGLNSLIPLPQKAKLMLRNFYLPMQSRVKPAVDSDDQKALAELKKSFLADNEMLQAITQLDIRVWE